MNQKYLEQTWLKLESALVGENSRAQSHRISKRNINSTRIQCSRSSSFCNKSNNSAITPAQLKKIYKAKCDDMNIPVLADQESRFMNFCLNNFTNRKFHMKECGLSSKSAAAIGKVLKTSNFAYINLCKNSLGNEGTYLLLKEICSSSTIVHLDVSNNDITPDGFENIGKILSYHPSLISIDISSYEGLHRNRLSSQGAISLGKAIKENNILQFLSLSGTCLGDGIDCLAEGLKNNRSLVYLNISNNNLIGRHMELLSKAIIKTELKELNLADNKIGDEGSEFLSNMMIGAYEACCPLIKLNLSNNDIGFKGGGKVFHSLRMNCFIKVFIVSGNHFNQGLSTYFPSFLADNSALTILNLSNSNLKPESFLNISEGLAKNKGLESLILANNKIEDLGIKNLASGLAKNQSLKSIDLTSCNIKGPGASFLANSLKTNFVLETLILKDNSVKDEAGELFVELTRINKNFLNIVLDLNPVNLKYVDAIKSNLKENKKLNKKQLIPKIKNEIEKKKVPIETFERKEKN